jgi:hemoglobin
VTDASKRPPLLPLSNASAGDSPVTPPVSSTPAPGVPPAPLTLRASAGGERPDGNFYESIGGRATFERLVREFYRGVATDPVLAPMYPETDFEGAIQRLTGFLEQYWGGPTTYSEQRGHPRLRMRHMPFRVNPDARDRWLTHMRDALDTLELSPLQESTLWGYLERAAHAMVNTFEE